MLEVTVDKFIFRVPEELLFTEEGIWLAVEGKRARIGLSDFVQQVNGDIAFANVIAAGSKVNPGDEIGSIETIKVNLSLPSPVKGQVLETNPLLQDSPEMINQDPYGKGWMASVELLDWEKDKLLLLDAPRYLSRVKELAEAELKK